MAADLAAAKPIRPRSCTMKAAVGQGRKILPPVALAERSAAREQVRLAQTVVANLVAQRAYADAEGF